MATTDSSLKISVIICSYNRADYIIKAIQSLYDQTLSKEEFEVLVVDNNSIDNTAELVTKYQQDYKELNLSYFTEKKQGASFARNTGTAFAKASLVCFMDDDAIAEKKYLERVLDFFKTHTEASGLGGKIIPLYIPEKPAWMSHYVSSMVGHFDYNQRVCEFEKGKYPLESNMIVRKHDFDAIGGFNTDLPGVKGTLRIGGEGKEFFFRLKVLNKKIFYDPNVVVHHIVEVKKLTPQYLYSVASGYGRGERVRTKAISQWAFIKKIFEYLYKLGGAIVIGIFYAIKGTPKKTRPLIQFRIDALKGLLEKPIS